MKKKTFLSAALVAGMLVWGANDDRAQADAIVTMSDRRIEGRIVSEDADSVLIDSSRYGQLRFFKRNLKSVERGELVTPTPVPPTPSSTPEETGNDSPFGGFDSGATGDASPFGSAGVAAPAPAPQPAAAPSNDPFGSGAPATASSTGVSPERKAFGGLGIPATSADAAAAPESSAFGSPQESDGVNFSPTAPLADQQATTAPSVMPAEGAPTAPVNVDDIAGFASAPSPPSNNIQDQATASAAPPAPAEKSAATTAAAELTGPPEVKMGYDGVIYGMTDKAPVEARPGMSANWAQALEPLPFRQGQELRTNATQSVRIAMRGRKDELRIADQTSFAVEKLSADLDQVAMVVQRGSIWGDIEPRRTAESYTLRTPETTAAIRGTRFGIDRIQGATRLTALAGTIELKTELTGVGMTIGEGQTVIINSLGQILDVKTADPATLARWDSWDGASEPQTTAVSQAIAEDNQKRDADLKDFEQSGGRASYQERLSTYARAFEKLAEDTKQIPKDQNAWAMLRYNPGLPNWNGPYLEGPIPPVDPWRRALIYKRVQSPTGRVLGRVYSLWQDGRDQGGENTSVDKVAMVMYYNLDAFKNDPNVNPREK
ncbi:FecR domain-containing protein [Candidatus Sumerlaeota bacterium]|nr:FecR domain-containing protein [Candidatus Sumerlaeota bacterium]